MTTDPLGDLLDAALNGSRSVDAAAVDRAEADLLAAKDEPWAATVISAMIRTQLRSKLTALAKRESVVLFDPGTGVVGQTTMHGGVKRRTSTGMIEHQTVLFHTMTWAEVKDYLTMIQSQIMGLMVDVSKAKRMLELEALFPASTGPGDAAKQKGTTLEDWMRTA